MRLYWVLMWDDYYPSGGLGNVVATFESKEDAEKFIRLYQEKGECPLSSGHVHKFDNYEVVNIQDMVL